MDKKELKLYVTPEQEIIDLELEAQLLAGSGEDDPNGGELPELPIKDMD
jgi:hypothetical protein